MRYSTRSTNLYNMNEEYIDQIEYVTGGKTVREIIVVFTDVLPTLSGHTCERASIEWESSSKQKHYPRKTRVYVTTDHISVYQVKLFEEVCPWKALAYVCNNIEYY